MENVQFVCGILLGVTETTGLLLVTVACRKKEVSAWLYALFLCIAFIPYWLSFQEGYNKAGLTAGAVLLVFSFFAFIVGLSVRNWRLADVFGAIGLAAFIGHFFLFMCLS